MPISISQTQNNNILTSQLVVAELAIDEREQFLRGREAVGASLALFVSGGISSSSRSHRCRSTSASSSSAALACLFALLAASSSSCRSSSSLCCGLSLGLLFDRLHLLRQELGVEVGLVEELVELSGAVLGERGLGQRGVGVGGGSGGGSGLLFVIFECVLLKRAALLVSEKRAGKRKSGAKEKGTNNTDNDVDVEVVAAAREKKKLDRALSTHRLALCSQALLLSDSCLRRHDALYLLLLFVVSSFSQGKRVREREEKRAKEEQCNPSIHTVKLSLEMIPAVAFSLVSSEPEEGRGCCCCSLTAAAGAS